jgi:hypothetical protein
MTLCLGTAGESERGDEVTKPLLLHCHGYCCYVGCRVPERFTGAGVFPSGCDHKLTRLCRDRAGESNLKHTSAAVDEGNGQ